MSSRDDFVKWVVTPEGIPVRFQLATPEERVAALGLDLLVMVLLLLVPVLLSGLGGGSDWVYAVTMLGMFLLRNLYFVYFEIRWQGSTPGKRHAGIRVVDRRGGPLDAKAVFARNLTREFELFLPILVLATPEAVGVVGDDWVMGVAMLWVFLVLLLPLVNKDRMRLGDLVAGTVVVKAPKTLLYADLTDAEETPEATRGEYVFTVEQLEIYGIYELQVLEDLLRQKGAESRRTKRAVADKIVRKIEYRGAIEDPFEFLEDFYAAQRGRLEGELLLGRARERKGE